MDPRIRQRRDSIAHRRERKRLRILIGAGCLGLIACGVLLVLHSSLFSARHVVVRGARRTPVAKLLSVAGLARHPPLLDVDPGVVSTRLEELPWVARAVVERHWPDSVTVTVTERVPVATVALRAGGVAVIDGSGRVLAHEPDAPPGTVVLGIPEQPGEPGSVLGGQASAALMVARNLPPGLRSSVRGVVAVGDGVVLDLGGGLQVTLGVPGDLSAKFSALESLLAGKVLAGPAMVDLTIPDEPSVTPIPRHA